MRHCRGTAKRWEKEPALNSVTLSIRMLTLICPPPPLVRAEIGIQPHFVLSFVLQVPGITRPHSAVPLRSLV
jgi:hypothetical protein